MQKLRELIGIFAVAILISGGVWITVFNSSDAVIKPDSENSARDVKENGSLQETKSPVVNTPVPVTTLPASFTRFQVATHNDSSSCWSIVNGNVYDLTDWINSHPGGQEAILEICGKDGSEDFNEQHRGDGGPAKALAQYKIGFLK